MVRQSQSCREVEEQKDFGNNFNKTIKELKQNIKIIKSLGLLSIEYVNYVKLIEKCVSIFSSSWPTFKQTNKTQFEKNGNVFILHG